MNNSYGDFFSVFSRRADATAFVTGSEMYENVRGRVMFYSVRGGVIVRAEFTGLPKGGRMCAEPVFAFHIHGGTACAGSMNDAFAAAGTHYNPLNCQHPFHAGDLPPLFGADGRAFSAFLTNRFTVREIIGRTVIVHSAPDDFTTQPSGNSGEKIACGIITPTAR